MKTKANVAVAIALVGTATLPAHAQDLTDSYSAHALRGSQGSVLPYRLFVPGNTSGEPLPLIVYLHGGGGSGTDNLQQLSRGNSVPLTLFASPQLQAHHPAFVVAPQATDFDRWFAFDRDALSPYGTLVIELVDSLISEHDIDPNRVYLTGISNGGRGTWDIAGKRPDLFAAAVPSCGDGTPYKAASLGDLPIWVFHGAQDVTVPVEGARAMVAALRTLGSPVKYTEYPDAGHDACIFPYGDPELPEWLFAQRR